MWKFIKPRPGNLRLWQLAVLVLVFSSIIALSKFRRERYFAYLDPWQEDNALNKAYQLTHSLIAFGRGELFGQGLGSSIEKLAAQNAAPSVARAFARDGLPDSTGTMASSANGFSENENSPTLAISAADIGPRPMIF